MKNGKYSIEVLYPAKTDKIVNLDDRGFLAEVFRLINLLLAGNTPMRGFKVQVETIDVKG